MREWLLDDLRYDDWANRLWAPHVMGTLEEVGWPETPDEIPTEPRARAADVFAHILFGQRLFLRMCGREIWSEGVGWLDALHDAWIAETELRDPAEIVVYTAPDGSPRARPYADLVRHIVHHGTYHRGQLREIAETMGLDYPETDFTHWRTATA